jgi:DNA-binding NarL/FixJ family response regulator
MNPNSVKLYLADDHQILIDGLIAFFNEITGFEVIGFANDGLTLMRELQKREPDVVLLDMNMPKLDGISALKRIKKEYPQIKVIILSNYTQSQFIKEARENGASGYVLKNGSKKELLDAIEAVTNGGLYFETTSPDIKEEENNRFDDDFIKKFQLTKREIEIIKLICAELSTKEISDKLFISEYTTNTHRKNILAKLQVKNSAGIINFAREHELV